ncbi:MAG: serine/threonine protein kinase [Lentisphaerales bacterium]|nr:serine/threonine protein kinase [Lentisphaerales bacterium]
MSLDYRLDKYYDEADTDLNEEFVSQLTSLDRYKELSKIASGGMKTIFKGFDEKSQRYIAYATLNDDASTEYKEAFIKEARLTAKLSHPNIIHVYNMGLNENQAPFFTMELKTGNSLKEIIQKLQKGNQDYTEKYNLRVLLGIFQKVCDAIDYAHSLKVLHLDIKPDNIQVGNYGEVIVCDWGLSKIYDQQIDTTDINQQLLNPESLNTATLHGHIKGSPGFMAPEQIEANLKKTPATDIFSLGCLLYSILSYQAPFISNTVKETLELTCKGDFKPLVNIPYSLNAVVKKAMEVDIENRYNSVSSLKSEIENFITGYATEAEGASSLKLLQLFINRNKALSLISCVSLLIIIFGTTTFISNIQTEKNRAEENLALLKSQKEETNKAQHEVYKADIHRINNFFHERGTQTRPLASHKKIIRNLIDLTKDYPQYTEAKSSLGYHYFIAQEYQKSYSYLKKHPGYYAYMLPHLEKYKETKKDRELLSPEAFTKLLSEIKPYKVLHLKKLIFYSEVTKNKEDLIPAIKHLFQRINPQWNPKNFNYHADSRRINIYGMNFKHLSKPYKTSPLQALSIKSLSIKNTEVEDISSLTNIPIRALDISNTNIPFHNLRNNLPKALLRITTEKDQFKKWQIEKLPAIIEFIESD